MRFDEMIAVLLVLVSVCLGALLGYQYGLILAFLGAIVGLVFSLGTWILWLFISGPLLAVLLRMVASRRQIKSQNESGDK